VGEQVERALMSALGDVEAQGLVAREVHGVHLQRGELLEVEAAVGLGQPCGVDVLRPQELVARNARPFHRVDKNANHDGRHAHAGSASEEYPEGNGGAEVVGGRHGQGRQRVKPGGPDVSEQHCPAGQSASQKQSCRQPPFDACELGGTALGNDREQTRTAFGWGGEDAQAGRGVRHERIHVALARGSCKPVLWTGSQAATVREQAPPSVVLLAGASSVLASPPAASSPAASSPEGPVALSSRVTDEAPSSAGGRDVDDALLGSVRERDVVVDVGRRPAEATRDQTCEADDPDGGDSRHHREVHASRHDSALTPKARPSGVVRLQPLAARQRLPGHLRVRPVPRRPRASGNG